MSKKKSRKKPIIRNPIQQALAKDRRKVAPRIIGNKKKQNLRKSEKILLKENLEKDYNN